MSNHINLYLLGAGWIVFFVVSFLDTSTKGEPLTYESAKRYGRHMMLLGVTIGLWVSSLVLTITS